jgi:acyl transferase domain-containing protein
VFAGQSAIHAGMGRKLYEVNSAFRGIIDRCSEVVEADLGIALTSVLYGAADPLLLDDARYAQTALFALQCGLAAVWQSWDVNPDAVAGHSLGEYAAACIAGAMSLDDGIALVLERGKLTDKLAQPGRMAVIMASPADLSEILKAHGRVTLAAINAPEVVVVSGPHNPVKQLLADVRAEGIVGRELQISHPFHSSCVDPMLDGLERAANQFRVAPPAVPFVSSLYGRLLGPQEVPDAKYWRRHAREPVQFHDAVHALHAMGCSLFVDLGPHATLNNLQKRSRSEADVTWANSLKRNDDDLVVMGQSACTLWLAGIDLDLAQVSNDVGWSPESRTFSGRHLSSSVNS